MLRRSTSAWTLGALFLVFGSGLVACGGETDLNFVGTAGGSGGSGGSDGGKGGATQNPDCGDGTLDDGEACDDSNSSNGDGCGNDCAVEAGYTCDGEPSECVSCGNEVVEGTEQCDDGNTENGDGCSSACAIEGSCEAPIVIALDEEGDGLVGTVSAATGEDDPDQVAEADCAGDDLGGGPDRIFQFETTEARDIEVTVGANFDAIVRITSNPCEVADDSVCVDDVAVSAEERARLNNAPPGIYYVVVDGKTAAQAGTFSVDVTARCPLDGLKLNRIVIEAPYRTEIVNMNAACGIDLSRVGITAEPAASDSPATLPDVTIGPLGRKMLTSESPPPTGTIYQGNITYEVEDYAGAFYLCRGACNASGSNVIDAFRWEGASGAPSTEALSAVNFDNEKAALDDRLTKSYFRSKTDGAFPDFKAADWEAAYFVETFETGELTGWIDYSALFYDPTFVSVDGTIGARSLALSGSNDNVGVWNGPRYAFKDNLGAAVDLLPTYVGVHVRGSDKALSHGEVFFGHAGGGQEDDGFGSLFRTNGTLGFGSPAVTVFLSYNVETWYFVEYKNFDYSVPASPTVEVFVNNASRGTLTMSTPNVSQISLRNLDDATAWIDQIVVK